MLRRLFSTARPQFARNRLQKLQELQEQFNTSNEQVVEEQDKTPENVSSVFYEQRKQFTNQLVAGKCHSGLMAGMIENLKTRQELDLFKESLVAYRSNKLLFSRKQSYVLLDTLLNLGEQELMFDFLRNKYLYGVYPKEEHITQLMEKAQDLDFVYKVFTLLLYHHIPPQEKHYDILVRCGLDSGTEEGVRRSLITLQEKKELGWSIDTLKPLFDEKIKEYPNLQALYEQL